MTVIRDPKSFYFDFDWPENVDKNLKHETQFTRKSYESLAGNKIKPRLKQLLSNYKHGNNVYERGKQQN